MNYFIPDREPQEIPIEDVHGPDMLPILQSMQQIKARYVHFDDAAYFFYESLRPSALEHYFFHVFHQCSIMQIFPNKVIKLIHKTMANS